MYFSKITLNPSSARVRKELSNIYEFHRTIKRAFPLIKDIEGKTSFLYRIEKPSDALNGIPVYFVSEEKPGWNEIIAIDKYLFTEPEKCKNYNPYVNPGMTFSFRLRANPTVKRNEKRIGLYKEKEQIDWFTRKAGENGFIIHQIYITNEGLIENRSTKQLAFLSIIYDGTLRVTDVDLFKNALFHGIGSAKGFGFGLLTIAR